MLPDYHYDYHSVSLKDCFSMSENGFRLYGMERLSWPVLVIVLVWADWDENLLYGFETDSLGAIEEAPAAFFLFLPWPLYQQWSASSWCDLTNCWCLQHTFFFKTITTDCSVPITMVLFSKPNAYKQHFSCSWISFGMLHIHHSLLDLVDSMQVSVSTMAFFNPNELC